MAVGSINDQLNTLTGQHNAQQAQINDLYLKIVPAGVILMWSGSTGSIPAGWALCNGASGTPDLRDRFIVGAGNTYGVGNTGGATSVALSIAEMPSHSHAIPARSNGTLGGAGAVPGVNTTDGSIEGGGNTSSAGSSLAHENRPPYYALAYIMKLA